MNGLWNEYSTFKYLSAICILFILGDGITTYYGVGILGGEELNPLYRLCGNLTLFLALKIILTALWVMLISHCQPTYPIETIISVLVTNIIYAGVVFSNLHQLLHLAL